MTTHRPLTRQAHELLAEYLSPGEIAMDATAGNGHDTLFLAHQVGPGGTVHAFDIQAQALAQTRDRLRVAACDTPVFYHHCSHAEMLSALPASARGQVSAVTFNLGYLPGADHNTTTRTDSTLAALNQSLTLLRPDGVLSVLAYRGHPGGREEAEAVAAWCARQDALAHAVYDSPGPVLHLCRRAREACD